jgi:hypothetical protein
MKAKRRILDDDTYKFDGTGFQIGVTASEFQPSPIGRQLDDRE